MEQDRKKAPIHEQSWFKGTAAAVVLLGGIVALVGAITSWSVVKGLFEGDPAAASNTEIILDTSAAMGEPFEDEGKTKLEAAVGAIGEAGQRNDEGLALRVTSPECGEEDEDLLVDFGTNHTSDVVSAAEEQSPAGKANITEAIVEALGDFRNNPQFNGSRSTRRVLVFTSGLDECFEGDAAGRIESELKEADVSASFTLIALKASEEQLEQLGELEEALTAANANVETRAPQDSEELEGVVEEVKEESAVAVEEGEEEQEEEKAISG
jgi:hypothetical protein